MQRRELEDYLNQLLQPESIQDYCPNGLQVEGKATIQRIVTGVTASQALVEAAIEAGADALLVHHGYFWKGEPQAIRGMKKQRIQALLQADINLFAYHLPLDVHAELGNNVQLARHLGWQVNGSLAAAKPAGVVLHGEITSPMSGASLAQLLSDRLGREVTCSVQHDRPIKTLAWCTGGGQGFIDLAAAENIDAFITGEVSEQTIHSAREQGIDFLAAGHHATERYGIQALGEHLAEQFGLKHQFIDIDNPA